MDYLKRELLQFKGAGGGGGDLEKKEGVVFLRVGWYPNAHYGYLANCWLLEIVVKYEKF